MPAKLFGRMNWTSRTLPQALFQWRTANPCSAAST